MTALLAEGLTLTVIGMGVVFGALVVLMFVIMGLTAIFQPPGQSKKSAAENGGGGLPDTVLAAAVGWFLETESPPVFMTPVTRAESSNWARSAPLSRRMR